MAYSLYLIILANGSEIADVFLMDFTEQTFVVDVCPGENIFGNFYIINGAVVKSV